MDMHASTPEFQAPFEPRVRPPAAIWLLMLFVMTVVAYTGCGRTDIGPAPEHNLRPARQFVEYPLFYVGSSFRGLPLTGDGHADIANYHHGTSIAFLYGQCELPPGGEGGCAPPVQIDNFPSCVEYPGRYRSLRPRRFIQLRGVPAAVFHDYGIKGPVFDKLELYSRKTTIVIRANAGLNVAREIAQRLQGTNVNIQPRQPLPPPRSAYLHMKRSCRGAERHGRET
jgi:hypothetical protein